jgi:hypothetical protein
MLQDKELCAGDIKVYDKIELLKITYTVKRIVYELQFHLAAIYLNFVSTRNLMISKTYLL